VIEPLPHRQGRGGKDPRGTLPLHVILEDAGDLQRRAVQAKSPALGLEPADRLFGLSPGHLGQLLQRVTAPGQTGIEPLATALDAREARLQCTEPGGQIIQGRKGFGALRYLPPGAAPILSAEG